MHPVCTACGHRCGSGDALEEHISLAHPRLPLPASHRSSQPYTGPAKFYELEEALKGAVKTYRHDPPQFIDPNHLNDHLNPAIGEILNAEAKKLRAVKWSLCVEATLIARSKMTLSNIHVLSFTQIHYQMAPTQDVITAAFEKIKDTIENVEIKGSGWSLYSIDHVDINIVKYVPLAGTSYMALPKFLAGKEKHSLINPRNTDDCCFRYAVMAALHWKEFEDYETRCNPESYARFIPLYDFSVVGNETTIDGKGLRAFERANRLSLNVFGCEDKTIFPIYVSDNDQSHPVDLLYISNGTNAHYVAITSLHGLVAATTGDYHELCRRCLQRFNTRDKLEKHLAECQQHSPATVAFAPYGEQIEFRNVHRQLRVGAVVYGDFESLLIPGEGNVLQRHRACSAAGMLVSDYDHVPAKRFLKRVSTTENHDVAADDPANDSDELTSNQLVVDFVKFTVDCAQTFYDSCRKKLQMTDDDKRAFACATKCHICGGDYVDGDVRTRDHDHWSGAYRGSAHSRCNLSLRVTKRLPVFFHGLRNYDGHLILKALASQNFVSDIAVIPLNMHNYISFSLKVQLQRTTDENGEPIQLPGDPQGEPSMEIAFLDTCSFLGGSLANVATTLDACPILEKEMRSANPLSHLLKQGRDTETATRLLKRKGTLPYDYLDSAKKFDETSLPERDRFYSILHDEGVSNEDYAHAQNVWSEFRLRNLGEYTDLYLATDCILLADCFEKFRQMGVSAYGLDPAHYLTAPSLALDACLKLTGATIDPVYDAEMHLFIERGIRGGLAQISQRLAKANNAQAAISPFDISLHEPTSFLIYLDMNNLYGTVMVKNLPYGDLQWVSDCNVRALIRDYRDTDSVGYLIEVDLDYPSELHDAHNDLPLAPERMRAPGISPLTAEQIQSATGVKYRPTEKLIAHLGPRRRYVVHIAALQYYLSLGMQLVGHGRVLRFSQSPWIRPYIELNTSLRQVATSDFERDFYKLMNNS